MLAGFYRQPDATKRHTSWELLKRINTNPSLACICFGDFNEIISYKEKFGGGVRSFKQMQDLKFTLDWCGLSSMHTMGPKFTWANNRSGGAFTKERLDRTLVNQEGISMPVELSCSILLAIKSDHSPLLINVSRRITSQLRRPLLFRYEAVWEIREECKSIVQEAWARDSSAVLDKLKNCKEALLNWIRAIKQEELHGNQANLVMLDKIQRAQQGEQIDVVKLFNSNSKPN